MNVGKVGSSSSVSVVESRKVESSKVEVLQGNKNLEQNAEKPVTKEELLNKVKTLNEFLIPMNTSLNYKLHEKLNRYYVQIVDDQTKEVIREIPNKKFLDMYAAMAELIGIVVDEKI
ncbi:flagellar protein FlaG [Alkalihalobacillus sp. AL-G]|uniref:flagellar protein FlaG n=1 Tax=Alkalihalobacillus sp. AL-G TaxID=2926399 RepID=UPI00272CB225|nr:flagellar protein FlaG [Alkalihalobacillus sp. AL-G]WLD92966.1 flagellar protein FlaG [Alkalihalobacillus sp. AL-G]